MTITINITRKTSEHNIRNLEVEVKAEGIQYTQGNYSSISTTRADNSITKAIKEIKSKYGESTRYNILINGKTNYTLEERFTK